MGIAALRYGMVGGGQGAFIGAVHRAAARLDGACQLVCGAFSREADNTLTTAAELGLEQERCPSNYSDLFAAEVARKSARLLCDEAIQAVAIVTPNHTHVPIAKAALESGFAVISDKPAGVNLAEVEELAEVVASTGKSYVLTHTYLGYPMVWQARHVAAQPEFGPVRRVVVSYTQGWLAQQVEAAGSKQAEWRTDPARSGPAGAFGDIGSHAHSLVEFIVNSRMTRLSAHLRTHFDERVLDDDGEAIFELENGATGVLIASQVCAGDENDLSVRVYGEHASLEWRQMEPNTLIERRGDGVVCTYRAGVDKPLCSEALTRCRLPSGHPEGYLEAFANLYRGFAKSVTEGVEPNSLGLPGIAEAMRGMAFLEAVVASSAAGGAWTEIKPPSAGRDRKGLLS